MRKGGININFAERVKLIKKQKGITNDELSAMTGIPIGTLGKLLAGVTSDPKLTAAMAIADALGTSLDFLSSGKEEPKPLFTASRSEELIIKKYRTLDEHGRDICDYIISKEYDRVMTEPRFEGFSASSGIQTPVYSSEKITSGMHKQQTSTRILQKSQAVSEQAKRVLPLYNLPVSAGTGVYLDNNDHDEISVISSPRTALADFALRVSGDSMEPLYSDGDILLVHEQNEVEPGELGVFIADGEGYFKKFGGDRLISLNPEYDDILLSDFNDVYCRGQVIGRLRRRSGF